MPFKPGKNNIYFKHGMCGTRIHNIWKGMKSRCHNKNDTGYHKYGEKGIKVNYFWRKSFGMFYQWAIENKYKDTLVIDRKNNNKGYYPSNCRWVTVKESLRNTGQNHLITINNETKCMAEWAEINNLSYPVVRQRIYRGWNPTKAITTPVKIRI